MMSEAQLKSLVAEAVDVVEARLRNKEPVKVSWVVQQILAAHPLPGDLTDREWHIRNDTENVKSAVRRAVQRYDVTETAPEQLEIVAAGYERLQRAYSVTRSGEQQVVPLDELTPFEINAKLAEMVGMKVGLEKHIDELTRFMRQKFGTATA
jgi:hypothetical protein